MDGKTKETLTIKDATGSVAYVVVTDKILGIFNEVQDQGGQCNEISI